MSMHLKQFCRKQPVETPKHDGNCKVAATRMVARAFRQLCLAAAVLSFVIAPITFSSTALAQVKPKPALKPAPVPVIDAPLLAIKAALQSREYEQAVQLATSYKGKAPSEALLLKTKAYFEAKAYLKASEIADVLLKQYPKSVWYRKALFLKAESLNRARKFAEAEAIFEAEANRILSADRKRDIANVIVKFADALSQEPDENDPTAAKPEYSKAYQLYGKALTMEIDAALRDQVMYKRAYVIQKTNNHAQAIRDYTAYLRLFDPTWTDPGAPPRKHQQQQLLGQFRFDARYRLPKSLLATNAFPQARRQWEDLLQLIHVALQVEPAPAPAGNNKEKALAAKLINADKVLREKLVLMSQNTNWQIVRTFNMPSTSGHEIDLAVKTARAFLKAFPAHPYAVEAAWRIGETLHAHGRFDDAVLAFNDFILASNYKLPQGDAALKKSKRLHQTPAELKAVWTKQATYRIGQIRFTQRKYADAITQWKKYITQYPNGAQWADAQRSIISSQFMMAVEAVSQKKHDVAVTRFNEFLVKYPLDNRARQILFTLGQITYSQADELEQELIKTLKQKKPKVVKISLAEADREKVNIGYRNAIAQWQRLVSKYPNTEEASVALYRIGLLHEEKLSDLAKALESYRKLTWGSKASSARARVTVMTKKFLELKTERKFRTNETASVQINVRNIEKLTVKQYYLDLEAYFRKTHGTGGVENLDIALIEPDKQWEIKVDQYAKYKPFQQHVGIPFDQSAKGKSSKAGVCIINISNDSLQATTLVVRSDLDLILKTSKREMLVYVQDMVTGKPAADVQLLASDGKEVFATGVTGKDGVFRQKVEHLKDCGSVRIFAQRNANIASNMLSLHGMGFSKGLSAKGYVYTDRPAYQPGQTVNFKGILREVKDGQYVVPEKRDYTVRITDPQGRLLREEMLTLNAFGTFSSKMILDESTPLGNYTITAKAKSDANSSTPPVAANPSTNNDVSSAKAAYSGVFRVQRYQLQKMQVKLDFDRKVYFRGEKIKATIKAEFYWGEPVIKRQVRYTMPDGRVVFATTNNKGEVAFEFDTSNAAVGRALAFAASIEGENVAVRKAVWLATRGFSIGVKTSQPLVLAGEPFDVIVTTKAPGGKAVGKQLTMIVLRREITKSDPVLRSVPWISALHQPGGEVTVSEHKVETDPKTGEGKLQLKLEKGGQYVLRVAGEDRFENPISKQGYVQISDDQDRTKLRLFADAQTVQVGQDVAIRLHSRLKQGIGLVTFEGEGLIGYRLIDLKAGFNSLEMNVAHAYYPNFVLSVTAMDGKVIRAASKPFTVQRQLNVVVKPKGKAVLPGEPATVEIEVTDQLGKPVKAELSVALVDEALYSIYRDNKPNILAFFQSGAFRHAQFKTIGTNGFHYNATTKAVAKEIVEEASRLAELNKEQTEVAKAIQQLRRESSTVNQSLVTQVDANEMPTNNDFFLGGQNGRRANVSGQLQQRLTGMSSGGRQVTQNLEGQELHGFVGDFPNISANLDDRPDSFSNANGVSGVLVDQQVEFASQAGDDLGGESIQARQDMPGAGFWDAVVVTEQNGKATVTIPMPNATSRWRITARGVTVQTLVGQSVAHVITRKDFFVNLKAPTDLREGDKPRILARVHNLTDYEGAVELTLVARDGDKVFARLTKRVDIDKQQGTEVLFDAFQTPAATHLEFVVSAQAGDMRDQLATNVPVRPWGIAFADHGGGVSTGDAAFAVELPKGRKYETRRLVVAVGPSLNQSVLDLALAPGGITPAMRVSSGLPAGLHISRPVGGFTGSELLAAIGGIEYGKLVNAPPKQVEQLIERSRSLIASLVVTQQKAGGWSWHGGKEDWRVTAVTYWALVRANAIASRVESATLTKARNYLKTAMTRIPSTDTESRALLVHALSVSKSVDFTHVNALHRERNSLSPAALAYTALAFVNIGRKELAGEMLAVLEAKANKLDVDGKPIAYWAGKGSNGWVNDSVETTAVTLLALVHIKPNAPLAAAAASFLMNQKGCFGFSPAKARGPAVAALSSYYGKGKQAGDDYKVDVVVGSKTVATINAKKTSGTQFIDIPAELIGDGATMVHLRMTGAGQFAYAATLHGFSSDLKDPASFRYPYVKKRYYRHTPLEYNGKPISAASTSAVHNLEIGQRTRVWIDLYGSYDYKGFLVMEEHLPAGTTLVDGSLKGNFRHVEIHGSRIVMYFPPGYGANDVTYELVGYATGEYRALPTVLRDAINPGLMRLGQADELTVLAPNEKSPDPYQMNDSERLAMGTAYFNDGLYQDALRFLPPLFDRKEKYSEREVARMLMWIHTSPSLYNAKRVVETFEVLRRRYPELTIPFDKILVVGKSYRDIGEHERAMLVFRATIDNSFINDSYVSAMLEDEGQLLASIDYQKNLWREYPDTTEVVGSYFALASLMYEKAPDAAKLFKQQRRIVPIVPGYAQPGGDASAVPSKTAMYKATIDMVSTFMAFYPEDPLVDDAAFTMCNVLLDMKASDQVVKLSTVYHKRYAASEFVSSFKYMTALGYLWQREYADALKAGKIVADGSSKDRDFSRYILGQVYHAQGKPADAIKWYDLVKKQYSDAKGAIEYFERKNIKLEEVTIVRPGKAVELKLSYRNIKEAAVQVYKVDLMKLYLREKNLSKITSVNLAGISPQQVLTEQLGDGKDYVNKETQLKLKLKDEGAYLVICRGDDLFTSGLVLISPLEIQVQEDTASGQVRVNIVDKVKGVRPAEVHVKAIGSAGKGFRTGESDLRGVFVANNLRGKATVIARDEESRYAFYRGKDWLGQPMQPNSNNRKSPQQAKPSLQLDYQDNLREQQTIINSSNSLKFNKNRRRQNKGVQVKDAY